MNSTLDIIINITCIPYKNCKFNIAFTFVETCIISKNCKNLSYITYFNYDKKNYYATTNIILEKILMLQMTRNSLSSFR